MTHRFLKVLAATPRGLSPALLAILLLCGAAFLQLQKLSAASPAASKPAATAASAISPAGDLNGWSMSGDGSCDKSLPGQASFTQEGKAPLVVQLKDTGADDYILAGQLLLAKPLSMVTVAVGDAAFAEKKPKENTAAVRFQLDKAGRLSLAAKEGQYLKEAIAEVTTTWLDFSVRVAHGRAEFNLFVPGFRPIVADAGNNKRHLSLTLLGAKVKALSVKPFASLGKGMLPCSLDHCVNQAVTGEQAGKTLGVSIEPSSLPRGVMDLDGVPFCFSDCAEGQAVDVFQLKREAAVEKARVKKDPKAALDSLALNLPGGQYSSLHLIAFATSRLDTAPRVSVRLGFVRGGAQHWVEQAVSVGLIDDASAMLGQSVIPVKLAGGKGGYLHHVRVSLAASADLKQYENLVVEFGRDISIPPESYMVQLVDAPSNVVILAATAEQSPLEMDYTSDQAGNVIDDSQKMLFKVQLTNRGDKPLSGKLTADCSGPGLAAEKNPATASWSLNEPFSLIPGETKLIPMDLFLGKTPNRGWYSAALTAEADGIVMQSRQTTFAVLAADTRKATSDSPFGIWCFWGNHCTTSDPARVDKLASLIQKGGWRWTYGGVPSPALHPLESFAPEVYKNLADKYKFMFNIQTPPRGNTAAIKAATHKGPKYDPEQFAKEVVPWLADAAAKFDNSYMVLHDSRTSTALVRRFSEFFGGEPYNMPADEQAKLAAQFKDTVEYCRQIKQAGPADPKAPKARIVLFNDYPAFAGEYLKRKFPAELFDVIGLESGIFNRQPERQPDWLCLLGTLHQARRMQQAYGYNKPIWFTEALYHPTEPLAKNAMGLHEQAVVAVREAMLALANGVERMAAANVLVDRSDDDKSAWGTAGLCFKDPEYNPKPAFAMYAWMTQVLDQAKFAGKIAHASTSLHALDFKKPDGSHVYPMWVVRGRMNVKLKLADPNGIIYDCYGNKIDARIENDQIEVPVNDTPVYLTGTVVSAVLAATPIDEPSVGKVVLKLQDPRQLKVLETRLDLMEKTGTPAAIRGQFKLSSQPIQLGTAVRIELQDDKDARKLVPRYVQLQLASPLELPARPFALDLHTQGHGNWGRIVLEMTDAKGQVFTSSREASQENMGRPYVNFDGWYNLRTHLPGQYAGDPARRWPAGDDWTGPAAVTYPLKLTKIIVTMRPSILYVDEERPVADKSITIDEICVIDPPEGM